MKVIPTASYFDVDSDLEKADVEKRLREKVRAKRLRNLFAGSLIGEVYWSGFEVKKDVWFNVGFNPVFRGTFDSRGTGVKIRVNAFSLFATVNAIAFWVVSLSALVGAFVNLFHADYASARICAGIAIWMGGAVYLSVRAYYHTIRDVHKEFLALFNTKADGKCGTPQSIDTDKNDV